MSHRCIGQVPSIKAIEALAFIGMWSNRISSGMKVDAVRLALGDVQLVNLAGVASEHQP